MRQEKNQLSALAEKLKQQLKERDLEWRNAWQAQLGNVPFPVATPVNSTSSNDPSHSPSPGPSYLPSCLDPHMQFGHSLKDRPALPHDLTESSAPFAFNIPSFSNELSTSDERRHRPSSSPSYHSAPSSQNNMWQGPAALPPPRPNFEQRPDENFALSSHQGFREHIEHGGHYMGRNSTSTVLPQIDASGQYMPSRSLSPTSSLSSPLTSASTSATHLHYYPEMSHSGPPAEVKLYTLPPPLQGGGGFPDDSHVNPGSRRPRTYSATEAGNYTNYPPMPSSEGPLPLPRADSPEHFAAGVSRDGKIGEPSRLRRQTSSSDLSNSVAPYDTERARRSSSPRLSSTLAVIKAQAFGALRRTRNRPKKSTDGFASRAALEALEARGLGLGLATPSSSSLPRNKDTFNSPPDTAPDTDMTS